MTHVLESSLFSLLFWLTTVAWLAEPFAFPSRCPAEGPDRASRGERLAMVAGIMSAFALAAALSHLGLGNLDGAQARALRTIGLVLYAWGAVLRWTSARCLGALFTRDVRSHRDQELIERGPYRWLRHPLYVGLFALGLGLVLQLANPVAAGIGALLVALPIARRARREERVLRATVGSRYQEWCARRRRLLPGLF